MASDMGQGRMGMACMDQGMCADCKAKMKAGKSDAMCADCKAKMGACKDQGMCADCKAAMKAGKTDAMCADCKAKMGTMKAGKECACESTDCDGDCDGTCAMCRKMDGDQAAAPTGFPQTVVVASEEECGSCALGEGELIEIAAVQSGGADDCGMAECPEGMKATCESVKAAGAECPAELKAQCEEMKAVEAANSQQECPHALPVSGAAEAGCDAKKAECDSMEADAEECPFAQQARSVEAAKTEKDCCAEKGKAAVEASNEAKSECDAKAKSECEGNQAQQAANQTEKPCCKEKGATDPSK